MFCQQCGTEINTSKKFCTNCGWKIELSEVKEEVKKVVKKEPAKKEIKTEKKEISTSNKSLQKKYGPFFAKLSSNLKQQPLKSKVEKNVLKGKTKQSVSIKMEKNKVVENKETKFNKPLLFVIGLASLGGLLGIADYFGNDSVITYEESDPISEYLNESGDCCNEKFFSGLWLERKLEVLNEIIFRNPRDSEAFYQRAKTFESDGDFNSYCFNLEKAMGLGNRKARNSFYEKKYNIKEMKRMSCDSKNINENNEIPQWKLKGIEKQPKWINNGKYSFDSNGIDIDFVHFNSYGAITYEAPIREDKSNVDDEYFYDYQINVACYSGEIYSWEDNKWITPKTKNKKSLVKAICKEKDNDPAIIPLLISSGWKKYSNDHWVNVNGWEEDESTEYKDFDTNYYKTSDQELSQISVDCSDDTVAVVKKGEWTKYKNAKGIFKEMLNDKCGLSSSSLKSSSNLIEWERDNGQSVIFDPSTLKGYREDWYDEDKRARRRLNYKYIVEDKDGESKEYRVYLWCRKYKAALEEDGTDMYDSSGGYRWLGLRKSDTYAKREAVKIIKDFCPKFKEIETRTVNRYFSDEV